MTAGRMSVLLSARVCCVCKYTCAGLAGPRTCSRDAVLEALLARSPLSVSRAPLPDFPSIPLPPGRFSWKQAKEG